MTIEMLGVGCHNKGAELMAVAILEHYRATGADHRFVVVPAFGTYEQRARYGLRTRLKATRFGRSALAAAAMTASFRNAYGLALDADIDAILDASGFAYSDQWGPGPVETVGRQAEAWKRQGKHIVLLPQAFGPFRDPRVRRALPRLIDHADLVYARDPQSLAYLTEVVGERDTIRLGPDFTNLVHGILPEGYHPGSADAVLVPNVRMMDKTSDEAQDQYVPFLAACVEGLRERGLRPVMLYHSPEDARLGAAVREATRASFDEAREADPVRLKGILGSAHLVVASRFHAIVGALSQGVPCLGTGWSHKYEALYAEYQCPECLIPVTGSAVEVAGYLDRVASPVTRPDLVGRLRAAGATLQAHVARMWDEVDAQLGLRSKPTPEAAAAPVR